MHFGPAAACHTWSITHGLPFARSLIQVIDDGSYAHIRDLVESSPAEFWEPIAQRELHWLHIHHRAWLNHTSGAQWVGWRAETAERLQVSDIWVP